MLIIGTPNNAICYALARDPETGEQLLTMKDFLIHGSVVFLLSFAGPVALGDPRLLAVDGSCRDVVEGRTRWSWPRAVAPERVIEMEKEKINLLIVDDEEQFLESMKKRLEVRDFHVITVNRGDKAIEAARKHPIDIALVDLKMPGMSGEETLEALKKEHEWMEVVILTGHGSVDSAVECTKSGAYSYLQKPCELRDAHRGSARGVQTEGHEPQEDRREKDGPIAPDFNLEQPQGHLAETSRAG